MFLRLVQSKVDTSRIEEMKRKYAAEIITRLQDTRGCLYAGLVRSVKKPGQVVSLTLWETQQDAQAYERSGLFSQLFDITRPYFSEPFEWKLALSEDLRLEYNPVPVEPVIKAYAAATGETAPPATAGAAPCPFFRFVSMLVQPGKITEFRSIFSTQVLPTVRSVPGCCYVQLAQNVEDPDEFISFTVWQSREHAERYEKGAVFPLLTETLKPTLSALSQWQMDEGEAPGRVTATSEDLTVHSYSIMVGKSFIE